ncbi:MAG: lysophospholipase L1-like esterase [Marivirga sp.]|jgi:lysophospholipase L1-like esterase
MNIRYTIGAILSFPLLPIMYFQAKKVKNSVPKLPEAEGIEGRSTYSDAAQKTIRMLAIGESTIAGVGVTTHQEGFTGTLANALAEQLHTNIIWKVYARSGYTAKRVTEKLIPKITETNIDLLIVGIGGNDAFTLNKPERWKKETRALIINLKEKFPNTPIFFCSMPPIKEFPAFTSLIKATIGSLVEILGEALAEVIKDFDNVYYEHEIITINSWNKKFGLVYTASDYFSDGVHPSKLAYQSWAKDVADRIVKEEQLKKAVHGGI